jgi:feruloyl-CoA synthase
MHNLMRKLMRGAASGQATAPTNVAIHERFGRISIAVDRREDGTIIVRATDPVGPYPELFHDYLFRWARAAPRRTFLAERRAGQAGWATCSYGEAAQRVRAIAAALAERPLGEARPVLILSGNSIEHQMLALGCTVAGIPYSPISTAYSLVSRDFGKLKYILSVLDPALVYAADAKLFAEALALPEIQGREIVVGAPDSSLPSATPFSRLLDGGSTARLKEAAHRITPDSTIKLLFTSGSTGTPKGVVTTHRMLNINLQMLNQAWRFFDARPPVLVDWLPWNHVFGGNHNVGQVLRAGGTLYIDDGKPLPGQWERSIRNLREIASTAYFNVPIGFDFLLPELRKDDELRKTFFRDLDVMFYAAASLPEHVWRGLEELAEAANPGHPASMITGWGLTEAAPSALILNKHGAEIGNAGLPLPGVELKLIPNGQKLEARIRGENVMPGYWRLPDVNARVFDDEGFFITGDALAFIDERDPERGFRFNGRVTEDFKLATGTWVNVGEVKTRAMRALAALAADVIVTAPDREELGLFIFPPPGRDVDSPDYVAGIRAALHTINLEARGSSSRVARALVMREPASLDKGEMTDKGSLNMRAVLEQRKALVEKLYNDTDLEVIRP